MKTKHLFILIILSVTILSCEDLPINPFQSGTLTGTILDENTSIPVEEVLITTVPGSGTGFTNASGEFTIENIKTGNYSVYAFKDGYSLSSTNISITADIESDITILLENGIATGSITGNIYDISGTVSFANISTSPGTMAVISDAAGNFNIADIPIGEYEITASKPGYVTKSLPISVNEDSTTQSDFVLSIE